MARMHLYLTDSLVGRDAAVGNESVLKIIINDTIIFFLNCNQHFGYFKP